MVISTITLQNMYINYINDHINNHIAEHHLKTNHRMEWDSAECVTYSTDYYQRITLESWFTNLEQTPLNRC